MPRLIFLFLLLVPGAGHAGEDPLCANHKGIKRLNPFGDSALAQISGCIPLYCNPEVQDAPFKGRLKRIDHLLERLDDATVEYGKAFQLYRAACEDLMRNFGQVSEKMQVVRRAYYNLEKAALPASERYAEIQSDRRRDGQEMSTVELFTRTGETAERQYRTPACKNSINETTLRRLNENDAITRQLDVLECAPPGPENTPAARIPGR